MNLEETIKIKKDARARLDQVYAETERQFQQEIGRIKAEALKLDGAIEALTALAKDGNV